MILADVNVLICAFRRESPFHGPCRAWLAAFVCGDARFGVSPLALSALARITTDRRIFVEPSSIEDAFGFCDDLLSQPHCEIIEPGERHWSIFKRLCDETGIRGRGDDGRLVCRARHRARLRVDHLRSRFCSVSGIGVARAGGVSPEPVDRFADRHEGPVQSRETMPLQRALTLQAFGEAAFTTSKIMRPRFVPVSISRPF